MEDLAYNAVIPSLFCVVPEAKESYDSWEMPGDPLPYIVFSFLEESLFTPQVVSGGNPDLLARIFDFLECMALSRSDEVINLLWVGLFEAWAGNPEVFAKAADHMRPATKELASAAVKEIAGHDLRSMG